MTGNGRDGGCCVPYGSFLSLVPVPHLPQLQVPRQQHGLPGGITAPGGPPLPRGDMTNSSILHPSPGRTRPPWAPSTPALGDAAPQAPITHCSGMQGGRGGGGAAARPHLDPDRCLPGQAQPRSTCPRCAMAARWWTPRHHPCEGHGDQVAVLLLLWHPAPSPGRAAPAAWPARGLEAAGRLSPCPGSGYTSHALGHGTCHPSLAPSPVTHPLSLALSYGARPFVLALSHGEHPQSLELSRGEHPLQSLALSHGEHPLQSLAPSHGEHPLRSLALNHGKHPQSLELSRGARPPPPITCTEPWCMSPPSLALSRGAHPLCHLH